MKKENLIKKLQIITILALTLICLLNTVYIKNMIYSVEISKFSNFFEILIYALLIFFIFLFFLQKLKYYNIYTLSLFILKLADNPIKRRKKMTMEEADILRKSVKWKSPVKYPPRFDDDISFIDPATRIIYSEDNPKARINYGGGCSDNIDSLYWTLTMSEKYPDTFQYIWTDPEDDKKHTVLPLGTVDVGEFETPTKTLIDRKSSYLYELGRLKSDNFLGWNGFWDHGGWYFVDQILYAFPLLAMFLFVHCTVAEIMIVKFKCQQHYSLNEWVFGSFPLCIYYMYIQYQQFHGPNIFSAWRYNHKVYYVYNYMPEWPFYSILYDWWLLLFVYFVIVVFFYYLAPNNIYLRNNNIMKVKDYSFILIPCLIILLLPPIFAQKRLPFWYPIEDLLFKNHEMPGQYHLGITYTIVITILIALTSVLWFSFVIIIPAIFKAKVFKDETYYNDVDWVLFSSVTDESDWGTEDDIAVEDVPYFLPQFVEDYELRDWEPPTGWYYYPLLGKPKTKKTKSGKLIKERAQIEFFELWVGSYSKNILLKWYFSVLLYCLFIKNLSYYITWSSLLCISYIILLLLILTYIYLVLNFLKRNIFKKRRYVVYLLIFIVFSFFFIWYFIKDFLFIFIG